MSSTDTNQASELFELCKKVYEMTGWSDTLVKHSKDKHAPNSLVVETVYEKYVGLYENTVGCDECEGEYSLEGLTPLYTSDYLLEKLGDAELQEVSLYRCHHQDSSMNWCAIYDEQEFGGAKLFEYHDTPLLALLKLTIALSEAGELK